MSKRSRGRPPKQLFSNLSRDEEERRIKEVWAYEGHEEGMRRTEELLYQFTELAHLMRDHRIKHNVEFRQRLANATRNRDNVRLREHRIANIRLLIDKKNWLAKPNSWIAPRLAALSTDKVLRKDKDVRDKLKEYDWHVLREVSENTLRFDVARAKKIDRH